MINFNLYYEDLPFVIHKQKAYNKDMISYKVCSVKSCTNTIKAKKLCNAHYIKLGRYGNPDTNIRTPVGIAFKYFMKAMKIETDDCINWKFSKISTGYGQVTIGNRRGLVHREALLQRNNKPTKQKPYALHTCRNRGCFNYKHLRWGSPKENMLDKLKDGTDNRGTKSATAKLTDEQVMKIRKDTRVQSVIASYYGVSQATISDIKNRKKWTWL